LKLEVDQIAEMLQKQGKAVTALHGGKSQDIREKSLNAIRFGHSDILVATNVAARGIDIENVAHVINFGAPQNIVDYVHRIGRTGRAGNKGVATTFINLETDEELLPDLKKHLIENEQVVPPEIMNYVPSKIRQQTLGEHSDAKPAGPVMKGIVPTGTQNSYF
jgi:superfamily II DNA/RNA helicase